MDPALFICTPQTGMGKVAAAVALANSRKCISQPAPPEIHTKGPGRS